jgi:outer membrane protein assembly factor BamE (lipoprotein component of BamABCDE complex)
LVLSRSLDDILLNDGYSHLESAERKADFRKQFQPARFSPTTNSGVEIGMSKSQVRKILGQPDRSFFSKKFNADEFVYARTTKKTSDGLSAKYTNYYLFKKDSLYFIELRYDLIGGG